MVLMPCEDKKPLTKKGEWSVDWTEQELLNAKRVAVLHQPEKKGAGGKTFLTIDFDDPEFVASDFSSMFPASFTIGKKDTAEQSFSILRAGGAATIIGMIPQGVKIELDGASFLRERRIQGSSMGSNHFRVDMPRYVDFYLQGRLKLDELVSRRLTLEDVNEAFKYMKEGSVARSVMMFD